MRRVLVVDSNLSSANRIASALNKSGFEVLLASSVPEGLTMGERVFPDAIVVRDGPSQVNGFTLCRVIRRLFSLPLILLGNKQEEEVYSSTLPGWPDWDYYMHLPISYAELGARIKVLLWRYGKAGKPGA